MTNEIDVVEQVMSHAAISFLAMKDDESSRVRRALRDDAIETPALANDPDRVMRLCERYLAVINQPSVEPMTELDFK